MKTLALLTLVFLLTVAPSAAFEPPGEDSLATDPYGEIWSRTVRLSAFSDDSGASSTAYIVMDVENDVYEPIGWRILGSGLVHMRVEMYEDGSALFDIGTTGFASIQIYRAHPFTVQIEVESRHGQEHDPGPP